MGINGGMPLSYISECSEFSNPGHRTASVISTVDRKQGDQMSFWKNRPKCGQNYFVPKNAYVTC
jgi:hypothetical protein